MLPIAACQTRENFGASDIYAVISLALSAVQGRMMVWKALHCS
jgi:hypothetical protein